jgi:hypothetical protein
MNLKLWILFCLVSGFLFSPCRFKAQKTIASPRDSVKGTIGETEISINYGSPSVKGRKIWGKLVPYNKVWRSGANEATVFKTTKPVKIEGKELPAGEYGFFTIPHDDAWTIIFNKVSRQWGAFEYNENEDALRVNVVPQKGVENSERLKYRLTKDGFDLVWENLEVPVKVAN